MCSIARFGKVVICLNSNEEMLYFLSSIPLFASARKRENRHLKELNPREAADLLTYLNTSQGDLFKNAREGEMATWPQVQRSVVGKTEIARDVLDSYEHKNAYFIEDEK